MPELASAIWSESVIGGGPLLEVPLYRDCHGWSSIIAIHKEISVFTFSFNLNLTLKDIKVENR